MNSSSRGLSQAKPWPIQSRDPRLGLGFQKAGAALGRAKAVAFRPSWAGTALLCGFPHIVAQNKHHENEYQFSANINFLWESTDKYANCYTFLTFSPYLTDGTTSFLYLSFSSECSDTHVFLYFSHSLVHVFWNILLSKLSILIYYERTPKQDTCSVV